MCDVLHRSSRPKRTVAGRRDCPVGWGPQGGVLEEVFWGGCSKSGPYLDMPNKEHHGILMQDVFDEQGRAPCNASPACLILRVFEAA